MNCYICNQPVDIDEMVVRVYKTHKMAGVIGLRSSDWFESLAHVDCIGNPSLYTARRDRA